MSNASTAEQEIFVPRARSTMTPGLWLRGLGRLQNVLLLVWVAFVAFLPQNVYGLLGLLPLLAVWGLMLVVGIWHIVKVPATRRQAGWIVAAFPSAVLFVTALNATVGMPLVGPAAGQWLFMAVLSALPLYWLARWLLRTTRPGPDKPVRMRLTTTILLAVVCMLMLQSLLLVWVPISGYDFQSLKRLFGSDWYTNLLMITLGTAVLLSIVAVPYVILGFVRGSGHRGALIAILACIAVSILCTFGLLAFFAMLSYG